MVAMQELVQLLLLELLILLVFYLISSLIRFEHLIFPFTLRFLLDFILLIKVEAQQFFVDSKRQYQEIFILTFKN